MEEQAYKQLEEGQWTEARRSLESELATHPKNLEARYNLALLLQQAGHHDDEMQLYQKNMAYGWHLPTVTNLSALYVARGQLSQARAVLEKAAKRYRHEATPRYLLAELDEKAGNHAKARSWYEKSLKADPLNGFAHIRFARFLASKNELDTALKHALKAVRLQPTSASCLTITGDIQVKRKAYNDALKNYQKSLGIKPDPQTRQRLIDVLKLVGEHERANRMQRALDAWLKNHASS